MGQHGASTPPIRICFVLESRRALDGYVGGQIHPLPVSTFAVYVVCTHTPWGAAWQRICVVWRSVGFICKKSRLRLPSDCWGGKSQSTQSYGLTPFRFSVGVCLCCLGAGPATMSKDCVYFALIMERCFCTSGTAKPLGQLMGFLYQHPPTTLQETPLTIKYRLRGPLH